MSLYRCGRSYFGRGRARFPLLWLAVGCLMLGGGLLLSTATTSSASHLTPAADERVETGKTSPVFQSMALRQLRAVNEVPKHEVEAESLGDKEGAPSAELPITAVDDDPYQNYTTPSGEFHRHIWASIHFCECNSKEALLGGVKGAAADDLKCKETRLQHDLREARRAVAAVCEMKDDVISMRRHYSCQMRQARHWIERSSGLQYQERLFTTSRERDQAQQGHCDVTHYERQANGHQDAEEFIMRAKHKLMIAESLPAVASLSAVRHLLHAPVHNMSSLFDKRHRNMWQLRSDSQEPFTTTQRQDMLEEFPLGQFPHCAVVGSSGILLKYLPPLGPEIDQATVVVRVNQAPATKEYHDYVGSRTDIRVLNRRWTQRFATKHVSLVHKEDAGNFIIATRAETKYFERLRRVMKVSDSNATESASKMLLQVNDDLFFHGIRLLRAFRNGLQEATGVRFKGGDLPSSGFITTLLMMQMCKKTTLYGFSMGGCVGGCGSYHYFNNVPDNPRNHSYEGHTYANEGWLIKALHIMGTVCIEPAPPGLGPCGSRLGHRLTAFGTPQKRYGGNGWRDTATIVDSVSADPMFDWRNSATKEENGR